MDSTRRRTPRTDAPRLATLTACALLLCLPVGCRWIASYDTAPIADGSKPPARDAGGDGRAADGGRDGQPSDGAPARVDLFAPGCSDDGGCLECDPIDNAACAASCTLGDCDDLPQTRDPWPNRCNPALAYDFASEAALNGAWKRIHEGLVIYVKPCGALEFDVAPHTTMWMQLREAIATTLPAAHLVEARIIPPVTSGDWVFLLSANLGNKASSGRRCELRLRRSTGIVTITNAVQGQKSNQTAAASPLASAGGDVLQSYILDGQHVCRLGPLKVEVPAGSLSGGTVEVAARSPIDHPGFLFHLDWVRIFTP